MSIFNILVVLIGIVAILLITVILLQEPKERITPSGGGAMAVHRVGMNQKADLFEKATWILIGLLLCLTFLASLMLKKSSPLNSVISPNLTKLQEMKSLSQMDQTTDMPANGEAADSQVSDGQAVDEAVKRQQSVDERGAAAPEGA